MNGILLTGPSHATRWQDDIQKGRLPPMPGVTIWGEGGMALFSERLALNIGRHADKGGRIWLMVPDFRFGISYFNDHASFAETGMFINGYAMLQRDMITPERDRMLFENGVRILDHYAQKYGDRIRFMFWDLAVREFVNRSRGKYIGSDGTYRHPLWNYRELLQRYSAQSVDIWPMTGSFQSYTIDQQGHASAKGNALIYHAFRTNDGALAHQLVEDLYGECSARLFCPQSDSRGSALPAAVEGRNGVLFLSSDKNGVMEQHYGSRRFNRYQRESLAGLLEARATWSHGHAIPFISLVVPDKQSVYWNSLPEPCLPCDERPGLKFIELSAAAGIKVVYPLDRLRAEVAGGRDTYDKVDSHWNGVGGFAGYQELIAAVAAVCPGVRRVSEHEVVFSEERNRGDLGIKRNPPCDGLRVVGGVVNPAAELAFSNSDVITNRGVMKVYESKSGGGVRAVMFGDSFHLAMLPFLAESFSRLVFVHRADIDYDLVESEEPDVVIHEVAERFIANFAGAQLERPTAELILDKLRGQPCDVLAARGRSTEPLAVLHDGLMNLAAGRAEGAEKAFRLALALRPSWTLVRHYLGRALFEAGRTHEARQELELGSRALADPLLLAWSPKTPAYAISASEAEPDWGYPHHVLGQWFLLQKNLAEAEAHQRQAIAALPDSSSASYRLGQILAVSGRRDEAEAYYRKAVTLLPRHAAGWVALGQCFLALGKNEDARAAYEQAIHLSPHDPELMLMMGVMRLKCHDIVGAVDLFGQAVSHKPDLDQAFVQMGVGLRKLGRRTEALRAFVRAVELNPANASARRELKSLSTGASDGACREGCGVAAVKAERAKVPVR